ncbi:LPXTG cell wall anchor domain-containing protein [Actinospongicola halichondriae]|uniref:LPXTG cell wall anchor domain-containing protein n=1 Tax=Actinospongicola halichondriae TaxID=3236844 RepID=UPI003D4D3437
MALAASAALVLLAPTASAQAVSYSAESDAQALNLQLAENGLTVGSVHSEVTDAPSAAAAGTGLASVLADVGATTAEATTDGSTDGSPDEVCESDALPDIPGVGINLACSASLAAITDGNPASASSARVGTIELDPVSGLLIDPLGLGEVVEQIQGGAGSLLEALTPLTGAVPDPLDVDGLLDDVVGALDLAPLATIDIGATQVDTVRSGDAVTTTCAANGATINVLDIAAIGEIDAPPVISVIVGEAATSVAASTTGGDPVGTASPALVRVVVPALDLDIPVEIGQTIEIPLPDPLGTSTIVAADGATGTTEDGRTFATASAVSLDLLPGLSGGVQLDLADCASVAGATVAPIEVPETTVTTAPSLPRTGGTGTNGFALAGAAGLALAGFALLRRSQAV